MPTEQEKIKLFSISEQHKRKAQKYENQDRGRVSELWKEAKYGAI